MFTQTPICSYTHKGSRSTKIAMCEKDFTLQWIVGQLNDILSTVSVTCYSVVQYSMFTLTLTYYTPTKLVAAKNHSVDRGEREREKMGVKWKGARVGMSAYWDECSFILLTFLIYPCSFFIPPSFTISLHPWLHTTFSSLSISLTHPLMITPLTLPSHSLSYPPVLLCPLP